MHNAVGLWREKQAWKFAHSTYVTAPCSYHTKSKCKEPYLLWCVWVKYLLCLALKKTQNTRCERGFESGRKHFKSSLVTFSPFFPMQISRCHSPSEPDGWAECAAVPPTQPHTHLGWNDGGRGGRVMAQLLWFFCLSIRPTDTQEEWIIYNHFLSGSSDWSDSWPPNSLNLVICHSWEKSNQQQCTHTPSPHATRATTRTIWQRNLGQHVTTKWLPIQHTSDLPKQHDFLVWMVLWRAAWD